MTSRKFIFLLATFVSAQSGNDQLSVDTELINFDKILNQPIIDDERCDIYTDYFSFISNTFLKDLMSMQDEIRERKIGDKDIEILTVYREVQKAFFCDAICRDAYFCRLLYHFDLMFIEFYKKNFYSFEQLDYGAVSKM